MDLGTYVVLVALALLLYSVFSGRSAGQKQPWE